MSYKILGKTNIKLFVMPGDTVTIRYHDENLLTAEIDKNMEIDTLIVFEATDELGLKKALGGALGVKK